MSAPGVKIGCKVKVLKDGKLTPGYQGLAHIVRARYDEHFATCYGSVSVACGVGEGLALCAVERAILQLEDGRMVEVKFMAARESHMAVLGDQIVGEDWNLLYFVATARLNED